MRLAGLFWDAGELRLPEQVHETHTNHHIAPLVRREQNRLSHAKLTGSSVGKSGPTVELTIRKRRGELEFHYRRLRPKR